MAVTNPAFRRKFPLLLSGGLLAIHTVAAQQVTAAEQFDCQVSPSGGWACAPKDTGAALPPRPAHTASSASTPVREADKSVAGKPAQATPRKASGEDFSRLDWIPREQLTAAQQAEAGPYCAGAYIEPVRPGMDDDTPLNQAPMYLSAKASRYEQETQVATLAGDVVLRQGRLQVEADEANLHQAENRGELLGSVRLRDKGTLVVGERVELQLDNGEAKIDNAEYVLHNARVHGKAQYAKREANAIIRLKDGTYTRCEPGSNSWHLQGNNVTLNPETGFGSATNVTLRVKDVPVFYTPYIYFPIDDRRVSGFLAPAISSSSRTGVALQTPYYFNLAPNYDATLYPTYMTKRGLLLEGEGRYLSRLGEGRIGAAYLDDQEDERKHQSAYKDKRWMYTWQHIGGQDARLLSEVDYTDISDPYYFQDLSSELGVGSGTYVDQRGTLTWRGDSFSARLNAHAYELATVTAITPYDRLPQITLDGILPYQPGGLQFSYKTEFVRFDRDLRSGNFIDEHGNPTPWFDERIFGLSRANGDRVHLEPGLSLPFNWGWGFVKPSVKYLYTNYDLSLDSQGKVDLQSAGRRFDDSPDRSVTVASLDSGLYFDRHTSFFGSDYRQTLEPRAFYLYVPNKDQDQIPIFDSGEGSFSYSSLWRENRFSGRDRIGDANQLSLGLTSRWVQSNGFERQRVSLGQALYFSDRKVQMPGIDYRKRNDATSSVSPYALEYLYRFNRDWRFSSDFNWDPDNHSTRSASAMFHYQPEDNLNKVVNVGYRYRNDSIVYNATTGLWQQADDYTDPVTGKVIKDYYKITQHDLSTIWPIVPQWSAVARWQYDYNRNRTLEAFAGFEYDSCCWKVRLVNRYWLSYDEYTLSPDLNEKSDRGIFLQIVLKGLGGVVGNKVGNLLENGIEGYREREEQAF